MSPRVRVEITRPIATAVLAADPGRPIDPVEWDEIGRVFDDLSERQDVTCVVVRGTGARAPAPDTPGEPRSAEPAMAGALRAVRTCKHPTVAVIEGLCTGDALEIAACCDLRVCGESSRFGAPLERAGGRGSTAPLGQLLGWGPLLDSLGRGELVGAEKARKSGLVNRVVPDAAVLEQGYGLAARIAAGAPLINRWHKKMLSRLAGRAG